MQNKNLLYLSENNLSQFKINWFDTVNVIRGAVHCLSEKDFAQPIKPYLRYNDPKNRIIAMPAYIGGDFDHAGIKWIASFPNNPRSGIPRAHSVLIINDSKTGVPKSIINTPILSSIRTASVSGLMIQSFLKTRKRNDLIVGIIGLGPIGTYHYKMTKQLIGDNVSKFLLYDIKEINKASFGDNEKLIIAKDWQTLLDQCDILMTCTVASAPYIQGVPKPGSLHLNVSLRDYKTSMYDYFKGAIIVDDWEEVCRENTDIENMHKEKGLSKNETYSIVDIIVDKAFEKIPGQSPILFNPMGMGIFDLAVATYFYEEALENQIGTIL